MVPITQSLPLSKRDIYPAGRGRGKGKAQISANSFPWSFFSVIKREKGFEDLGASSQLEVHDPSRAQSLPGQAKCKQTVQDTPCHNGAVA